MTELKQIVVEHFPVDRLPDELRQGIESGRMVRVVVEAEERPAIGNIVDLFGSARGAYSSPVEAVTSIRAMRDEWDD